MSKEIIKITTQKTLQKQTQPTFHVKVGGIKNPHTAQFFIDYGIEPGPWVRVGINETTYSVGYLPEVKRGKIRNSGASNPSA